MRRSGRARVPAVTSPTHRVSIQRLRDRLPLAVFVLLLIFLVLVLGFACLCMSDHPTQAADRALGAVAHAPAVIVMWSLALLMLAPLLMLRPIEAIPAIGRASPSRLQRFRF